MEEKRGKKIREKQRERMRAMMCFDAYWEILIQHGSHFTYNHPAFPGAPLALVVGVPFGILLVLAAGLLIAITTVLILWRLRKQRRAYAFQRMTFSEVDDDDEKD